MGNPGQTIQPYRGIVSERVASVLRSTEIHPLEIRFVSSFLQYIGCSLGSAQPSLSKRLAGPLCNDPPPISSNRIFKLVRIKGVGSGAGSLFSVRAIGTLVHFRGGLAYALGFKHLSPSWTARGESKNIDILDFNRNFSPIFFFGRFFFEVYT